MRKTGPLKNGQETETKVVGEADVPKLEIVTGCISKNKNHYNCKILAMSKVQNSSFSAAKWQIPNKKTGGNTHLPDH